MPRDAIDDLVDAQLAKRPRPQFNCHKCGLVDLNTTCADPYLHCPKRFTRLSASKSATPVDP